MGEATQRGRCLGRRGTLRCGEAAQGHVLVCAGGGGESLFDEVADWEAGEADDRAG